MIDDVKTGRREEGERLMGLVTAFNSGNPANTHHAKNIYNDAYV